MSITSVITILGIVQLTFLLLLIIPNVRKNNYSKYAFVLLFTLILDLVSFLLIDLALIQEYKSFLNLSNVVMYIYGPVIYLYVRSFFGQKDNRFYLHFIPAALVLIVLSPFFAEQFLSPLLLKLHHSSFKVFNIYNSSEVIFDLLAYYLHISIYLILSFSYLKKQLDKGVDYQKHGFTIWIKRFLQFYFLIVIIGILNFILSPFFDLEENVQIIANFLIVSHVFVVSYLGYNNQRLLYYSKGLKYRSSKLSKEKELKYLDLLLKYFETNKPYLDQELTLVKISKDLNISSNYLSQIINSNFNKGVSDFVNEYRIELAKKYLLDINRKNITIEAIGNEVGFKSKSSFNAAFKKLCGTTPSQYIKRASS